MTKYEIVVIFIAIITTVSLVASSVKQHERSRHRSRWLKLEDNRFRANRRNNMNNLDGERQGAGNTARSILSDSPTTTNSAIWACNATYYLTPGTYKDLSLNLTDTGSRCNMCAWKFTTDEYYFVQLNIRAGFFLGSAQMAIYTGSSDTGTVIRRLSGSVTPMSTFSCSSIMTLLYSIPAYADGLHSSANQINITFSTVQYPKSSNLNCCYYYGVLKMPETTKSCCRIGYNRLDFLFGARYIAIKFDYVTPFLLSKDFSMDIVTVTNNEPGNASFVWSRTNAMLEPYRIIYVPKISDSTYALITYRSYGLPTMSASGKVSYVDECVQHIDITSSAVDIYSPNYPYYSGISCSYMVQGYPPIRIEVVDFNLPNRDSVSIQNCRSGEITTFREGNYLKTITVDSSELVVNYTSLSGLEHGSQNGGFIITLSTEFETTTAAGFNPNDDPGLSGAVVAVVCISVLMITVIPAAVCVICKRSPDPGSNRSHSRRNGANVTGGRRADTPNTGASRTEEDSPLENIAARIESIESENLSALPSYEEALKLPRSDLPTFPSTPNPELSASVNEENGVNR